MALKTMINKSGSNSDPCGSPSMNVLKSFPKYIDCFYIIELKMNEFC